MTVRARKPVQRRILLLGGVGRIPLADIRRVVAEVAAASRKEDEAKGLSIQKRPASRPDKPLQNAPRTSRTKQ
jgi:hypothetical protein